MADAAPEIVVTEDTESVLDAKERRKLRRQERKARQKLGHGNLLNPDTVRGAEIAADCNLKGEPGAVGMNRDPGCVQPSGQQFAVISWVAPTNTPQRAKNIAIKIRGVFATKEEAHSHAGKIWAVDPDFDIHVVDMYEWLVLPPPMEHQMQIPMEYNQGKLDRIMKGYYHQIKMQRQKHDTRVASAVNEGKRKANEWRREHGFESNESLSKKLDPANPERVPMLPKPTLSEGGWITDAAKGSLEAGKATQAEMKAKGGRTLEDLDAENKALAAKARAAEEVDLKNAALLLAAAAARE